MTFLALAFLKKKSSSSKGEFGLVAGPSLQMMVISSKWWWIVRTTIGSRRRCSRPAAVNMIASSRRTLIIRSRIYGIIVIDLVFLDAAFTACLVVCTRRFCRKIVFAFCCCGEKIQRSCCECSIGAVWSYWLRIDDERRWLRSTHWRCLQLWSCCDCLIGAVGSYCCCVWMINGDGCVRRVASHRIYVYGGYAVLKPRL